MIKLIYQKSIIDQMNTEYNSMTNEFIQYLARLPAGSNTQLPSLWDLSRELGISVARLREQLEVAKSMGLVKIRPHTGMERLEYSFLPPVRLSLAYSMQVDPNSFQAFADLRNHIEAVYWDEAVRTLTPADLDALDRLLRRAWDKLRGTPVQIPHDEHRELHLSLYRRLDNPFVTGILEAYWEAYVGVGLNMYADYQYLQEVWNYHQIMVEAIRKGNYAQGYQALLDHKDLLHFRPGMQVYETRRETAEPIAEETKKE